jgi:hypothetical protein
MKNILSVLIFSFCAAIGLYAQIEGSIFKFKNQWELGLGSETFFPSKLNQGIRTVYSPFAYLSPTIKGTYMRKLKFGKMDYGYKKIHFVLVGMGLNVHWMPTINDKIFYTGLNRADSTLRDTTILTKNRNGRATLSFFLDYTKEFSQQTGLRYRFGLGFEHHVVGLNFSNTTINDSPYKKSNEFFLYPPSLFSFTSTTFQWWLRAGIDKRINPFNYIGGTLMLGYGPEYKIVPDAQILSTFKVGIQVHFGFLGGYESVVRRK